MASGIHELQFPNLNIPITVDKMALVTPAGPIPALPGDSLYLSNLDDMIGARVFTPTIYFYGSNDMGSTQTVMKTLSDALASILVPYYPLSGRLRETKNGKLEVFFGPKQGALMVEAHSEMALTELGDLVVPNPAWGPLIYRFPNEGPYKIVDMPLLIAQVTFFICGGFSLGLRLCHCICDGLGAMQLLGAWAATTKSGGLVTVPEPCWNREFFRPRDPPVVKFPHTEFMKVEDGSSLTRTVWQSKLVQKCYRISREFQAHLKTQAQAKNNLTSTTFDAMAAHVWRSWVKAMNIEPLDYKLRLTFSINARHKLRNPPLKNGFYGNAVCIACAMSSVSDLVYGRLTDTARLIHEARVGVTEEYLRSTIDYIEVERPRRLEFGGKLTITQWTRFSMYESADFGWGRPIYAGPIDLIPTPQVCMFLPQGDDDHTGAMMGCDASILIASPNGYAEKDAKDNLSLAGDGFDMVVKAKEAAEAQCPRVVSCVDILALSIRDVVVLAGGPSFAVELGHRDGLISKASLVVGNFSEPEFDVAQLNAMFAKNNLTQLDMIAP